MPKIKTKKGVAKRFKISGKGKAIRSKACKGHLKACKNAKRKRKLRRPENVHKSEQKMIKVLIPYK